MIHLHCSALPDSFEIGHTATELKTRLGSDKNSEYIDKIASRVPSAAAEGLYALFILCTMLEKSFPKECDKLILRRNENGKPYFEGSRLNLSISHSQGIVVCALSDEGEVGVDIEATELSRDKAERLVERYFDEGEKKDLYRDPASFARIWTKKEAMSKFFGANLADFIKKRPENCKLTKISYHNFNYGKHPITLCTKRDFGTIHFTCDDAK